jgi:hypothetical protein
LTLTAIVMPVLVGFGVPALRNVLSDLAARIGFDVCVGGIGVYIGMEYLEGRLPSLSPSHVCLLLGSAFAVIVGTLLTAHGLERVACLLSAVLWESPWRASRAVQLEPYASPPSFQRFICAPSRGRAPPFPRV